ncbi:hypothetical protein OF83DRAFT_1084655 [Amylostereum chailletii]|nr:hypothetical protein OF83DRAFT_1084655 [Amylostereum chailletii]
MPKPPQKHAVDEPPPKVPSLSIKEAIALKRAEAKKAMTQKPPAGDQWSGMEEASPAEFDAKAVDDGSDVGRWPLRETIERARNSGSINLSTRSLPCIPSALFEIHLGITPQKLESVPDEPPLPENPKQKGATGNAPSWFDQHDLEMLKAWNNEIIEIQPEISLFGSLKTIDLHNNRLASLPETFADLPSLVTLDLSQNSLSTLPGKFFSLPSLVNLNISNNAFTSLPFNAPFAGGPLNAYAKKGDYFSPAVVRADTPLPKLVSLNAAHNKIVAESIDASALPQGLVKVDLAANPLGSAAPFLSALASLSHLQEIYMGRATLTDTSFPPDLLASVTTPFPKLTFIDLEETQATQEAVTEALSRVPAELAIGNPAPASTTQTTSEDERRALLRVIIGKKVVREAWEIEADRRAKLRQMRSAGNLRESAQAAASSSSSPPVPAPTSTAKPTRAPAKAPPAPQAALKEQWEIEAEQGLLTEGGRRRARALAALQKASAAENDPQPESNGPVVLSNKYWDQRLLTVTLPPLAPPPRNHNRNFSLVTDRSYGASTDLTLPTATLPLPLLVSQPFADTLRILELKGRRADPSFSLPDADGPYLPRLEELTLEGCALADEVSTTRGEDRARADTLSTLSKLFPSLKVLDLSYNNLTSAATSSATLSSLVLSGPGRAGLRHLRLRGNRLENLGGLQMLARTLFMGEGADEGRKSWTLEELDVRENSIESLGGELGLLPLDVFLVEGNVTAGIAQLGEQQTEALKLRVFWRSRVQSTVLASAVVRRQVVSESRLPSPRLSNTRYQSPKLLRRANLLELLSASQYHSMWN